MRRFLLGFGALLLTLILAIAMIGGRAMPWLHTASMAFPFIVLVPLFALLSVWPRRAIAAAFKDAFRQPGGPASLPTSLRVLATLERFFYAAGVLGLFAGLIVTFSFLDSDLPRLGTKLAACLIMPFHAVVLAQAARILRVRVEEVQAGAK